jgi:hypothetical protein
MRGIILVLLVLFLAQIAPAQSPLDVFGYAQLTYNHFNNYWQYSPPVVTGEADYRFHYMGVNQLNLLFSKEMGGGFSGLINLEFVNNYSSNRGFGSFNLQEAYVRYDYADWLKVKFGMVIPQFLAMYEIYNKTPLLPYITRPRLYEMSQGNLIDFFNILPQKALVHLNGTIPAGPVNMEYSAFVGNPPNSFISSPTNDMIPGYAAYGQSAVDYVTTGGRVGVRSGDFRAGVSVAFDKENLRNFVTNFTPQGDPLGTADLGDRSRTKLGFDLSATVGRFSLTGEYLSVLTDLPGALKDSLSAWNSVNPYFIGKGLNRSFYYVTLLYNVNSELAVYVMRDHLIDEMGTYYFGDNGVTGSHVGAAWTVNESVVLKAQITYNQATYHTLETTNAIRDYWEYNFAVGASVTF